MLWSEAKRLALLKWDILRKDPVDGWALIMEIPELAPLPSQCSFCDVYCCYHCPLSMDYEAVCIDEYRVWGRERDLGKRVQLADRIWDVINRLTKPENWPRE